MWTLWAAITLHGTFHEKLLSMHDKPEQCVTAMAKAKHKQPELHYICAKAI